MAKAADLTGRRFGRLLVLGKTYHQTKVEKRVAWNCQCDCGLKEVISRRRLNDGTATECKACRKSARASISASRGSALSKKPEYQCWHSMIKRCYKENCNNFKDYGGRGISVCSRWRHSFKNFLADIGKRPSLDHSIERRDNNGNYEPDNCYWATRIEQGRNKRSNLLIEFRGESKTAGEWEDITGISANAIKLRLRSGWIVGDALTRPVLQRRST